MTNQVKPHVLPTDFAIEIGQLFRKGPTVFRISEVFGTYLRLEHIVSLETKHIKTAELASAYARGELVPCTKDEAARAISGDVFVEDDAAKVLVGAVTTYGEKAVDAGLKILKYIEELQVRGYRNLRPQPLIELDVERIAQELGDEKPPKVSTIYKRWLAIERNGGDKRAAIPLFKRRGGAGKSRISLEANFVIKQCMDKLKNDRKAEINFKKIEKEIFHKLIVSHGEEKAILLKPSLTTITSIVKEELTAYEIYLRKYGRKEANKKYRNWHPRSRATFPLDVVEFDDKDTRVYSIDGRTGLPCGRVYLTSGVDQYSTVPLGFSISDRPRNTWSAINAIANSVLPKDLSRPEWSEVESDVPFMGLMGKIILDNALYNHARNLEEAALEVSNATISWAQPYTPTQKSCVEDFNGFVTNDFLINLPGFGGPKITRELLKEGIASAILTVQDFKKQFHCWVYDVYCNTPRVGGMTPRQKWEIGQQGRGPRLPMDIQRVKMATMFRHSLKLRPEGILFTGLIYNSHRLILFRKKVGNNATVNFRFDPESIEEIFVMDEGAREWFAVPSVNPEYVKHLTLEQHRLIRKLSVMEGQRNPAVPQLLSNRARLAKFVNQWMLSSKIRDRKFAARVGNIDNVAANEDKKVVAITELESQVLEISSVTIDSSDEGWEFPEL